MTGWGVALALLWGGPAAALELAEGKGHFEFTEWAGPAVAVYYYRPARMEPETRVVFVMHGNQRNPDEYRDQWTGWAEQYGFLLVVPGFLRERFPEREGYNFGNVLTVTGERKPKEVWGYTAVEKVFDAVRAAAGLKAERYVIYGHSAGAQFVHRLPYFLPEARAELIVSANAGAYMLPDFEKNFPYGLEGSGMTEADLRRTFRTPTVVLLGTADIDPNDDSLPRLPDAMAQGLHRFARGLNFFKVASEQAVRVGEPLEWTLAMAPGIGHSNEGMAAFAAEWIMRADRRR